MADKTEYGVQMKRRDEESGRWESSIIIVSTKKEAEELFALYDGVEGFKDVKRVSHKVGPWVEEN